MSEAYKDTQRILQYSAPDQSIQTFQLKTVTYGMVTSSFLATVCLKKSSEENHSKFPQAYRAIREDFHEIN